jgi:hypothetical protein
MAHHFRLRERNVQINEVLDVFQPLDCACLRAKIVAQLAKAGIADSIWEPSVADATEKHLAPLRTR